MPSGSANARKATQGFLFEINLHLSIPGVLICLKLFLSLLPRALQTCEFCKMLFCFLLRFQLKFYGVLAVIIEEIRKASFWLAVYLPETQIQKKKQRWQWLASPIHRLDLQHLESFPLPPPSSPSSLESTGNTGHSE